MGIGVGGEGVWVVGGVRGGAGKGERGAGCVERGVCVRMCTS